MLKMERYLNALMGVGLLLCLFQITPVNANDATISGLDVSTLDGDKLQIRLDMSQAATPPKIFETKNPARIALDFPGVKNGLGKKIYPVNQGVATNIYFAEAADRLRVVLNLLESTPFETKVVGNQVYVTLTKSHGVIPASYKSNKTKAQPTRMPLSRTSGNSAITNLMPQQTISGFDFKRGEKGEGRILISLANPNTIVNTKEDSGKVIVSFVNTQLTQNLAKRLDVSEFATPIKYIDTVSRGQETTMTVVMQNNLYDYSLVQSDGLLTIEFRALTNEEKEVLEKSRVKYTGERLSLNFQDIEVRSVIAILAEFTGQNVVAGDDVTGTITLKLDDVPWDEALDFVMMTKELGKYETGNVTLISPLDKIKDYKKKQQETEAVVEQLDPLVTEYIQINYAKAESFRNLLYGVDTGAFGNCSVRQARFNGSGGGGGSAGGSSQGSQQGQGMGQQNFNQNQSQRSGGQGGQGNSADEKYKLLSERGSAVVDARTNTLIVRETAKRLEEVKKLIRKLDITVRQVMIESRIVVASNKFARELGVKFGTAGVGSTDAGGFGFGGAGTNGNLATSSTTIKDDVTTSSGTPASVQTVDQLVDLGTTSTPYGALGMTLVRGADYVLNLELSALQDENRGELISNPRVMTSDRCQANIKQGVQIPYQTVSANTGPNIQFADAVLQLDVTPQITPNGSIIMDLFITKDAVGAVTQGVPSIDTRNLRTLVRVNDGETVVLGGIFEGAYSNQLNKVPFFADLPGIGFLFKRTLNSDEKKELLIFVTPKIIKDEIMPN